jgi:hypothetical protein
MFGFDGIADTKKKGGTDGGKVLEHHSSGNTHCIGYDLR